MGIMKTEKFMTLADRYTKALLTVAKENNSVDKISSDLSEIIKLFKENQSIEEFFTSPIVRIKDKKDVLEQAFKGKTDDKLYNFINVLADKNRLFILPEVKYLYDKHIAEENNILEVEAQTVIPLDENMQNMLKEKLGRKMNKTIKLTNTINTDIIGGVVLLYNGKVIDGSINTQLKNLQKQLV